MQDVLSTSDEGGGPSGIHGGGKPATAGSKKGDLFGDMYVILRYENGVPLLNEDGFVQPLDAEGNLIALDDEGAPVDPSLAIEVEIGRLNVGRSPSHVLERRLDEVVSVLSEATEVTLDPVGRLVFTIDGVEKTIDSPLENLAIYVSLLNTGTIPGLTDLPGDQFDFLVDNAKTDEDLAASTAFLAAATDKYGELSVDQVAYVNAFLGIALDSQGDVTWSDVNYADFDYSRYDTYKDVTTTVLKEVDGVWVPSEVNIYTEVFGNEPYVGDGGIDAYTQAADDARAVIEYIHEYKIPAADGA